MPLGDLKKLMFRWLLHEDTNRYEFISCLTHDLDFGTALALTKAEKPSVIQVRTQNVSVPHLSKMVISTLEDHWDLLAKRALIVIDDDKKQIRILTL